MKRASLLLAAAISLAAFGATPAIAQRNVRDVAGPPAEIVNPTPNRRQFQEPANLGTRTPRFLVELVSIRSEDEEGATNIGDDEVWVLAQTPNYWTASGRFDDFDTQERVDIADQESCLYPARDADNDHNGAWSCDRSGAAGPVRIRVEVREHEEPLFDPFGLEDLCIIDAPGPPNDLFASPPPCASEDNLVGSFEINIEPTHPDFDLRREGDSREHEARVGDDDKGIFVVHYRVTRTTDLVSDQRPGLVARQR